MVAADAVSGGPTKLKPRAMSRATKITLVRALVCLNVVVIGTYY